MAKSAFDFVAFSDITDQIRSWQEQYRTAVRTGRTEWWEIDRLLALVAGLWMRAEIRLVPDEGAA